MASAGCIWVSLRCVGRGQSGASDVSLWFAVVGLMGSGGGSGAGWTGRLELRSWLEAGERGERTSEFVHKQLSGWCVPVGSACSLVVDLTRGCVWGAWWGVHVGVMWVPRGLRLRCVWGRPLWYSQERWVGLLARAHVRIGRYGAGVSGHGVQLVRWCGCAWVLCGCATPRGGFMRGAEVWWLFRARLRGAAAWHVLTKKADHIFQPHRTFFVTRSRSNLLGVPAGLCRRWENVA